MLTQYYFIFETFTLLAVIASYLFMFVLVQIYITSASTH